MIDAQWRLCAASWEYRAAVFMPIEAAWPITVVTVRLCGLEFHRTPGLIAVPLEDALVAYQVGECFAKKLASLRNSPSVRSSRIP